MFDYSKLIDYGFISNNNVYTYKLDIMNGDFTIIVSISNEISYKVYDNNFDSPFVLVGDGSFVNNIRTLCDNLINDICSKCMNKPQIDTVKEYIVNKYGDQFECLWKKYPNDGIFRNKKNNKWYALIMNISLDKIGVNSNKKVNILNVTCDKKKINSIINNKNIFPGYHMNKKSWITIILDNKLDNSIINSLIDDSYQISINKKS